MKFIENVKLNLYFESCSRTRQLTCDLLALLGCSLAGEHFIYSRKMFSDWNRKTNAAHLLSFSLGFWSN